MATPPKKGKIDRRAARSRRLILTALRELVLEKDYKDISVSDIVKRADIGRATFYAHFEDKNALGRFMFNQLLTQIEAEIQAGLDAAETVDPHQQLVPSRALFRIARAKQPWFKMNATNPEIGLGMLIPPLKQRLARQLDDRAEPAGQPDISPDLASTFLISGLVALLTDWVMADMPATPEAMDAAYQTLAAPTLARLLG